MTLEDILIIVASLGIWAVISFFVLLFIAGKNDE